MRRKQGFTIVELLIVIVVIAILAAITIVAYMGIQDRAKASAVQSAASQLAKQLEVAKVDAQNETYPATLASASITFSNTTYTVTPNNKGYCAVIVDGSTSYYVTQSFTTPKEGTCVTVNGLVGWWPFNGNVTDESGNNAQATAHSLTSTTSQNGEAGGAYTFNGSSSYISFSSTPELAITSSFSVSAWVNMSTAYTATAGWQHIVAGAYGDWGVGIVGSSSGTGLYLRATKVSVNDSPSTSSWVTKGVWTHVTATFDGTNVRYYINGALTGNVAYNPGYATSVKYIGTTNGSYAAYFRGNMDDVRVYNRPLTAAEVTALYDGGAQ